VSFSTCISFDSSGGFAIQSTKANIFEDSGGVVIGACAVGLSLTATVTKYDSVDELEGIFTNLGVSGNLGPTSVGGEFNFASDWEPVGGTISTGIGAGVDVHMSGTKTKSIIKGKTKNFFSDIGKYLLGVFAK
jgi:hypothetical protein